jgi:hypothetical protein
MDYLTPEDRERYLQRRELQKKVAESFREEAFQEGWEEGRVWGYREVLLSIGETLFGPLSPEQEKQLHSIQKFDHLERLFDRIVYANSWEELLAIS